MSFVNRERELADLARFWRSRRAQCIPVTGRRRVGKTFLLEHFAAGKRCVYYRCQLKETADQLPQLGKALADMAEDAVLQVQPPATWPAVFATIERLTQSGRLLLVLDEIPYWVASDDSLPPILQNWWDERGRHLDIMLVLCGSAVEMMEKLLTGEAPLAGCVTGRVAVRPFDFRAAAEMLKFDDAVDSLTAYGVLGGVPLYLSFFSPELSLRENVLDAIASPSARLYVEPQALFAAHHKTFDAQQALAVLRAIAQGRHQWSEILNTTRLSPASLKNIMDTLIGDLGLVERVLPVTEKHQTRAYYTQYHLTDNFLKFWFEFIEPNQGTIEFGGSERTVDAIFVQLPDHMGLVFESMCRDWVRLAASANSLPVEVGRVGTWWNPSHQLDVVGLDRAGKAVLTGESKWTSQPFDWGDLVRYLDHVRALGERVDPGVLHLLFSKSGFQDDVVSWAETRGGKLLTPADMLSPWS